MDCSSVHKLDSSVDISPSPLVQGNSPSTSSHSSASEISMDLMGSTDTEEEVEYKGQGREARLFT